MNWSQRDTQVIWHPYTQMKTSPLPLSIVSAQGAYLFTEDGRKIFDATSSWWVNIHGHSHPEIARAIGEQAAELEHVMFAGCTHPPAVELAEKLLKTLPEKLTRIFYSDNGSTAVEVALKMAIQYWKNRDITHRKRILALDGAYHGDTLGAMSVSAPSIFTLPFADRLFEVERVSPHSPRFLDALKDSVAFIYEPLLQGAGGMKITPPRLLDPLLKACRDHGVLLIADEVMTGFFRTGKMFASEHLETKPDIICLSKGLTGGALPLGVTACSSQVYEAFLSDDRTKTLFHGHSFTANPIACRAALASLEILMREETLASIQVLVKNMERFAQRLQESSLPVQNVRHLGTLVAWEVNGAGDYLNPIGQRLSKYYLDKNILLRPLGNTCYVLPPYCTTETELQRIYECTVEALSSA